MECKILNFASTAFKFEKLEDGRFSCTIVMEDCMIMIKFSSVRLRDDDLAFLFYGKNKCEYKFSIVMDNKEGYDKLKDQLEQIMKE